MEKTIYVCDLCKQESEKRMLEMKITAYDFSGFYLHHHESEHHICMKCEKEINLSKKLQKKDNGTGRLLIDDLKDVLQKVLSS